MAVTQFNWPPLNRIIIVNENLAFNDKYQMLTSVGWSHYTYYFVMPDPVRLHL